MPWDPALYEEFLYYRARPFDELLARVEAEDPKLVVDLGCGNGPATLRAAEKWPDARVVGVDSSPEMLERARELDTEKRVSWIEADLAKWNIASEGAPDVVLTNAALQWVPGHRTLIEKWCRALPEGAWFAMQVPGNFGAPSHWFARKAAAAHPRSAELLPLLLDDPVARPVDYAALLARVGTGVDVWETTYLQILDPEGKRENPVLDWMRSTTLHALLEVLDDDEQAEFLDDLSGRLESAYPRREYGVAFPFRRIFAVAQKG